MKFILFNVAVGAALIYLFAADGPELDRAAVRIQGAASELKARASEVFDKAPTGEANAKTVTAAPAPAAPAPAGPKPSPTTAPTVAANAPRPVPESAASETSEPESAGDRTIAEPVKAKTPKDPPKPSEEPVKKPTEVASSAAAAAPKQVADAKPTPFAKVTTKQTKITHSLPKVSEPAVAKRRQEVLDGIVAEGPRPVLKKGEKLMSADERRKRLYSLAEEMELLYARSLSR